MADLTFLLDTNVISEPVRPSPNKRILKKIQQYQFRLAISALTWHELLFGMHRIPDSARRRELEQYLVQGLAAEIPVLPYDDRAAQWHAVQRARLAASGKVAPFADGQIAAIAAVNQLTLVTRNAKDFRFFTAVPIEDWSS
ncbi:MAG: type II toxin-antitoxin system VapC family toxin [Burkholderiales bacterium]